MRRRVDLRLPVELVDEVDGLWGGTRTGLVERLLREWVVGEREVRRLGERRRLQRRTDGLRRV